MVMCVRSCVPPFAVGTYSPPEDEPCSNAPTGDDSRAMCISAVIAGGSMLQFSFASSTQLLPSFIKHKGKELLLPKGRMCAEYVTAEQFMLLFDLDCLFQHVKRRTCVLAFRIRKILFCGIKGHVQDVNPH